jgi:hypothetical protein
VALFNTSETLHEIPVDLRQFGWKGKVAIRDLWKKKDTGVFKRQYSQKINPHGVALFKLTPE